MYDKDEMKASLQGLEYIATDVDDTLTINGMLTSEVIRAVEALRSAGLKIILVTGRSGGACTTLSQYLPVEMVIAENGGVIIKGHDITSVDLSADHSKRLQACFDTIATKIPHMVRAQDNPFRLTDRSIDNRSLRQQDLTTIREIAGSYGLTTVISSVQTHILSPDCSKGRTLQSIVRNKKTVTVGDSANDESMFNPELFPLSVGVANIRNYLTSIRYKPRWIMTQEQGNGFIELANLVK